MERLGWGVGKDGDHHKVQYSSRFQPGTEKCRREEVGGREKGEKGREREMTKGGRR